MSFRIERALNDSQWEYVDKTALDILGRIGIVVPHSEARQALSGIAGVRVDGEVVRYERKIVQDSVRGIEGCIEYDTHVIAGAYCHNYLDPDTGQVRPPTTDDLISSIRQADALGFGVCAPVVPLDISGPMQELVMERLTHENATVSYGAGQYTSLPAAEAALEMTRVINRPFSLELWINSPLKIDGKGLDILWQLRHRKPPVRLSNMPARGMSAPISLAGFLAQSTAECLGGMTTLRLLNITSRLSYRADAFWGYAVDMKSGNVLLSGPEYLRLMLLQIFLAKRYGIKTPMAKALITSAKVPGIQAGAEKIAQGMAAALAGAGTFTAAGALSSVELYSPVQMVIDKEIVSYIDHVTAPIDFSENDFSPDIFNEVGFDGTFLSHETTVARFRDICWKPELFSINALYSWAAEGRPSVEGKAGDLLRNLAVREEPVVSPEVQKELRAIEAKFTRRL